MNRREFLKGGLAVGAGLGLPRSLFAEIEKEAKPKLPAKADSVIFIWMPGGIAQTDTWDPKKFTPYQAKMKGSELLGTCEPIPTAADGIKLGKGLEQMATVMDHCTILRSLTNETKFGAIHLKAQYYMMTGYLFPAGVKAPSIGAVTARTLGRRDPNIPPYIYIGRVIDTSDNEKLFINDYLGPGFYGINYAPFMIPDPARGLDALYAYSGMKLDRLDRRQAYLNSLTKLSDKPMVDAPKAADFLKTMENARAMMDSPVKQAFDYTKDEKAEILAAYEPKVSAEQVMDKTYYNGKRFGHGLLLARRLVERGARFVQVEFEYSGFKGFDMHEDGATRMVEMKKQIDGPIAQLIRDLKDRGLLERTLVVITTEFGRSIASHPATGVEPDGFAERHTGNELVIDNEKMYGFHGHFSSGNCMLFFGGGFKGGFVYGKTADRHPMLPIENPVPLTDVHATIYKALGIPADHNFVTEGRPFYVTKDGKGKAIDALLA